jgi:endogenous inhibitor of DNA gyrase (YacG/DUF329 family)
MTTIECPCCGTPFVIAAEQDEKFNATIAEIFKVDNIGYYNQTLKCPTCSKVITMSLMVRQDV